MNHEARLALHYAACCLVRLERYSAAPVQIPLLQRMELALLRRHLDKLEIALDPTTRRARGLRLKLWLRSRLADARQRVWEWRNQEMIVEMEREWDAAEEQS